MIIKDVPVGEIQPAAYNPRKDLQPTDPAYQKLAKAIAEFDLVEPLVWNTRTGNLVGGHQRFKILKDRGDTMVTVSVVDLGDREEKALNLALNKHSGEWDYVSLADLVAELDDGGFDMEVAGFAAAELEQLATWTPTAPGAEAAGDPKKLADTFLLSPFSVLNAREGWWQDRKRAWIALGIQSELGRGAVAYEAQDKLNAIMAQKVSPGGSPRPAMKLGADGKTVRGDGAGKPLQTFPQADVVRRTGSYRRTAKPKPTAEGGTLGAIPPNEKGEKGILSRTGTYGRKGRNRKAK